MNSKREKKDKEGKTYRSKLHQLGLYKTSETQKGRSLSFKAVPRGSKMVTRVQKQIV
jgi:phosphoribosylformylglycinamidine (FGAM) synthase PurS component